MDKRAIGNPNGVSGPECPLSAVAVTDCRALLEAVLIAGRRPRIVSPRPSGPNGPPAPLAAPPFVMPHWASGGSPTPRLSLLRLSSQAVSQPGSSLRQRPAWAAFRSRPPASLSAPSSPELPSEPSSSLVHHPPASLPSSPPHPVAAHPVKEEGRCRSSGHFLIRDFSLSLSGLLVVGPSTPPFPHGNPSP